MGAYNKRGFTIIEVLLFLAISGLLAMTLLTGWTAMINTQRYKDSIKTTQTFLQQQYNLVYNVQNGRSLTTKCTVGADGPEVIAVEEDDIGVVPAGQSNCIVMGRYVHINGSSIKVYPILGEDSSAETNDSDKQVILDRKPIRVQQDVGMIENELTIPWQAVTVKEHTDDTLNVAIVIVRSPQSGAVHTYSQVITGGVLPGVDGVMANSTVDVNLCMNPETALAGGRMGVVIKAGASAQSFVQTIADGEGTC